MLSWIAPVAFAAFLWWASTGVVLVLVRRPPWSAPRVMAAATVVALVALYGLAHSARGTEVADAYVAFACALLVWAWHELAFLCGWLTGPRHRACGPRCHGVRHFVHAVEAILWHELAILATAAIVVALTWDAPNPTGTLAFIVLWTMRASAKLNLFFGVRNLGEEFLPARMRYLTSFFRRRPMNPLFPFSVTLPTAVAALAVESAFAAEATDAETASRLLVAALLGLAILEHWMMVLPIPFTRLWQWALRGHRARAARARAARATPKAALHRLAAPARPTDALTEPVASWRPALAARTPPSPSIRS